MALIIAAAVIPTTLVLLYNLWSLREAKERDIHAEALRIAELVSLEMSQIVGGVEILLRAAATAPVARRGDVAECEQFLARLLAEMPQFVSIALVDADGIIRCMPGATTNAFLGDRGYFVDALAKGGLVVGEYNEGRVTGRPSLPIAIPLPEDSAWSGGVAVAGLDLGWLGERLKERSYDTGNALTIADRNGRILAREPLPEQFVGTVIPDAFQYLVRATEPGSLEVTSQDGTHRVIGYYPAAMNPAGIYVSAGVSTETAFAALNQAIVRGLAVVLASVLAAVLFARSTSRALIRRPLEVILDTIGRWRRADMTARTGMTRAGEGELGEIGGAIDAFMDELAAARERERRSEQQRELLRGELDHRVKNLIATIQAIARQSFPRAERTGAPETFIRRLATMAAAHELLMRHEWQEAGLRRIVETAIGPFDGSENGPFTLAGPEVTLNSRAALAYGMALHELCTNAAKYGALSVASGRVSIVWERAAGATGPALRLVWRESGGPPVAPPAKRGFGSRLIEQAMTSQIEGAVALEFPPEGLLCVIEAPLSAIESGRQAAA